MGIVRILDGLRRVFGEVGSGPGEHASEQGDMARGSDRPDRVVPDRNDRSEQGGIPTQAIVGFLGLSAVLVKFVMDALGAEEIVSEAAIPQIVTGVFLVLIVVLLVFGMYAIGFAIKATNTRSSGFMAGIDAGSEERKNIEKKHREEVAEVRSEYESRMRTLTAEHRHDFRRLQLQFDAVLAVLREFVDLVPPEKQNKVTGLLVRLQAIHSVDTTIITTKKEQQDVEQTDRDT